VNDVKERLPRFASSDELFDTGARTDVEQDSHSGSATGIPSILRSAPPANIPNDADDLAVELHEHLECLACDVDAFDHTLRRDGFAIGDLRSRAIWADDAFYVSLTRALAAASRSYVFDEDSRPKSGFRESLQSLAKLEGRTIVGRAIARLALDFDPVFWTRSGERALSIDEVTRGCELWDAFVRRAGEVAVRRRTGPAGERLPLSVELVLELSSHEFRALANPPGRALTCPDVLRAALNETNPAFALHALTVFLVANSVELARALDLYDEQVPDR
jgi:hypothetical protein